MRKVLYAFCLWIITLYVPFAYKTVTAGFRLGKLVVDLPYDKTLETVPISSEKMAAGQFTYLSRGAQSFVFLSEDGTQVLKLFRYGHRLHPWRAFFRQVLGRKKRPSQKHQLETVLFGAKVAFEQASDLTGLIGVHLNVTDNLSPIQVKDRLGRTHTLDLNRCCFAIQHRAQPLRQVLYQAIQEKDMAKAERLLRSFAALLRERALRGIRNADTKVSSNFGFLDEQAIEWDFGSYCKETHLSTAQEIERFSPPLRHFLRKRSPEAAQLFEEALEDAKR